MTPAKRDATSSRRAEQSILVVDPDRLSSTLISRMLERAGYQVEAVTSGVAALELLDNRGIAMMIAETKLPDLPLASLVARTRQLYTPMLPILAISADIRPVLRVEAIRLGVELVAKPVDPEELRARLELALRAPSSPAPESGVLAGDLARFSLHDILAMLDLARFTGKVQVSSGREVGACYLSHGRPHHATFGNLVGMDAFAAIVSCARGWFRVHAGTTTERTIEGTMTHVILNAAIEDAHRRRTPSSVAFRHDELGVTKHTASKADDERSKLARRLAMAVADGFRIGELDVGRRCAEPRDGNVLELAVFGEANELVAAMWEISAPIGPAALVAVTRPGSSLTWRFAGRGADRMVVHLIPEGEPSAEWSNLPIDGLVISPPEYTHALDPALRPYVQRSASPTLIVGEPRPISLLSPAPFNTIQWTGRRDLRGQMRDCLGQLLSLVAAEGT